MNALACEEQSLALATQLAREWRSFIGSENVRVDCGYQNPADLLFRERTYPIVTIKCGEEIFAEVVPLVTFATIVRTGPACTEEALTLFEQVDSYYGDVVWTAFEVAPREWHEVITKERMPWYARVAGVAVRSLQVIGVLGKS